MNSHEQSAPIMRNIFGRIFSRFVGRTAINPVADRGAARMGRRLRSLVATACLALVAAAPSYAATVDFTFTVTDGTNTITGLIEGLDSDGANQTAEQVTVYGFYDTYVWTAAELGLNSFTVSGGVLDVGNMQLSDQNDNLIPGENVQGSGGAMLFQIDPVLGGYYRWFERPSSSSNLVVMSGTSMTFAQVAAVPLPAGGLLLLSGVFGLAHLKRRKKSAA